MSKYNLFLISCCLLSFFFMNSCENSGVQPTVKELVENSAISSRGEVCEECPNHDDCCCGVWLIYTNISARLRLCGTTDGSNSCDGTWNGEEPCNSFSNGGQDIYLVSSPYRDGFCVAPGTSFWIKNIGPSTTYIYLTCQGAYTAPQIIPITLIPGEQFWFSSDGSCYLTSCAV